MNFTLDDFSNLTYVIFFVYIFIDTKIYLALWAALFHLIKVTSRSVFVTEMTIYKTIITVYVVSVLVGYLYKYRGLLQSRKKYSDYDKIDKVRSDKKRLRKMGTAILLLIIINITAILLWRK